MSALRKIFSKVSGKPEQVLKNEALCKAAIKGNLSRVRKLLDEGADLNARGPADLTPIYYAAINGFDGVCRLLLERGADPNIAKVGDREGSPLTQAVYFGHFNVVKTLVEYKADPNIIGYEWRNALHEAIWRERGDIAQFLIEAGARTDGMSRMGETPLHDAIRAGMHGTAMAMIRHGANIDALNDHGETSREKALEKGWKDLPEAAEQYKRDQLEAARRKAEQEQLFQEEQANPMLQSDITVKKPIAFRSAP
jgi:ankyrin repeat protein